MSGEAEKVDAGAQESDYSDSMEFSDKGFLGKLVTEETDAESPEEGDEPADESPDTESDEAESPAETTDDQAEPPAEADDAAQDESDEEPEEETPPPDDGTAKRLADLEARVQELLPYAQLGYAAAQQQAAGGVVPQASQPQPEVAEPWRVPHSNDPAVLTAWQSLVSGSVKPDALDSLMRSKVQALDSEVSRRWAPVQVQPERLVQIPEVQAAIGKLVASYLEPVLQPILRERTEDAVQKLIAKHSEVLKTTEDKRAVWVETQALVKDGMRVDAAFSRAAKQYAETQKARGLAKREQRVESAERQTKANQKARRGRFGDQQRGKGKPGLDTKGARNFDEVTQRLLAADRDSLGAAADELASDLGMEFDGR